MFGSVRFALAQIVVLTHLWPELLGIWAGTYAVFCFFIVSGYLMARTLDRGYTAPGGTRRFFVNRALRIYPPYLAVLLLAVVLGYFAADDVHSLNPRMRLPSNALHWASNLLIFGLHQAQRAVTLVPPAWSIDLELWLYLAIGLVLRRRTGAVVAFTALGAAFAVHCLITEAPFVRRYATLPAAMLPFGVGALVYHCRSLIDRYLGSSWHLAAATVLFLANALIPALFRSYGPTAGFYASVVLGAYLLAVFSRLHPRSVPACFSNLDLKLGALSYPIFLCHWNVGVIVIASGLAFKLGSELFLWSLPGVWLLAYAIHVGVERPLERLRDRIRGRPREELAGSTTAAPRLAAP